MANEKEPVSVLELPLKMEKWQADRINSVMDAVTKIYNIVLRKTNNRYKELIKTKAWRADTTRLVDLYNIQKSTEDAVKEQRSYLNKILKKETENLPDDDPNKEKIIADKSQKLEEEIEALIAERQQARKDRNFALADKIRDDLKGRGIELLDTPQGVRWKKVD